MAEKEHPREPKSAAQKSDAKHPKEHPKPIDDRQKVREDMLEEDRFESTDN